MSDEQAIRQAIHTLSQSDPLIKLLHEVKLGRMKPADAGLRAITDSWISAYQKVLETSGLGRAALARLDPSPRIEVLVAAGVLPPDHAGAASLRAVFKSVLSAAPEA
jgi:hypothetical protein